jgi:endonuclease/exonuclease/phosphatase family metal-dependent hydrolase
MLCGMKRWLKMAIVVVVALLSLLRACDSCTSSWDDARSQRRVGTYNIRMFGEETTDMNRLVAIVKATRADVLAVQEIKDEARMRDLAKRLSDGQRKFTFKLSECGGKSRLMVGFLYDAARVKLTSTREYAELDPDGDGSCTEGARPGLLGVFESDGRTFQLLVIHLAAGGKPDEFARRKEQWTRAHRIAASLRAAGPVAILGDTNSTGFLDDRNGERTFIEEQAKRAGLDVATRDLGCSEYFGKENDLKPSLLDHVVATPGLVKKGSMEVHGFCEELACAPTKRAPDDYVKVSDHCPVTFDVSN